MNKAERLLKLVTYLRSRRTAVTAAELSDRLEVSERTIYRDIQSLSISGIPVEGEAGIGYVLRCETSIAPLMFSESEIEAMVLGMRLMKSWADDEVIKHADSALTKIRAVVSEPLMHRLNHKTTPFLVPNNGRKERVKFSEQIRNALDNKVNVLIHYEDVNKKISERELEPLGLVFWGTSWTLAAWCYLREDYRAFRLDRIQSLEITDNAIQPNQHSLKDYLSKNGEVVDTDFWSV